VKTGFRGWLYRWISAVFGLVGMGVFLSILELSRLYGFPNLAPTGGIGLGVSFLLLMTAFLSQWSWKRYAVQSLVIFLLLALPYIALRPEMIRDDVLKTLTYPPLSADLVFYRAWALHGDPERDLKIQRIQFLYGFMNTYGEAKRESVPPAARAPIPEAK